MINLSCLEVGEVVNDLDLEVREVINDLPLPGAIWKMINNLNL